MRAPQSSHCRLRRCADLPFPREHQVARSTRLVEEDKNRNGDKKPRLSILVIPMANAGSHPRLTTVLKPSRPAALRLDPHLHGVTHPLMHPAIHPLAYPVMWDVGCGM